ncbi:Transcription factor GTE4 [Morus notabilis]|uniref:Transcription factor GTE4 n=1 Tax=Morus notabilis TaxID=981085 RepID=W9QS80_9ROSA|nr:transcription factor GTE4 isoform X2 [Morus notabilis]EXB52813.1 Transcription factor GTE4 [Morus notabilis]
MASGPMVEGGDRTREKQRYMESKVYTRKAFKGPKKNSISSITTNNNTKNEKSDKNEKNDNNNNNNNNVAVAAATDDTVTKNDDVNKDTGKKSDENSTQPPPSSETAEDLSQQLISRLDAAVSNDSASLDKQQVAAAPAAAEPEPEPEPEAPEPAPAAAEPVPEPEALEPAPAPVATPAVEAAEPPNPAPAPAPTSRDPPAGNVPGKEGSESQIKIGWGSRSKQEVRELRRKLQGELETVQNLVKRIEVKQGQMSGYAHAHVPANNVLSNGGAKRAHSEVAPVVVTREVTRPLHQLNISVLENNHGVGDNVEKEKRTPKANQFYRNSEFLLAKDKFPPAESNKKSKLNGKKHGGDLGNGFGMGTKFFKSCSSLLEKLMKHKHGWVFNEPVDAERLGLHDYRTIITHPMDLGTIKSRLSKNWYKSPKEFAEDVRLTFQNAMTYNPKGQDVHVMAEQLLRIFEERWAIIESDYNREMRFGYDYGMGLPTPTPRKLPPPLLAPLDMRRILDRSESMTHSVDTRPRPMSITPSARTPALKKPKAKDPHKRDMTYDEKQKLSTNLQSLPSEKLDAIVQIIKKRNSSLFQHDEEIEVDIDSVDAETLWELDRFVTNYKKSLSKNKRKAELAIKARAEALQNAQEKTQAQIVPEVPKENKTNENIISSSLPVRGDDQGDNRSRSSSSSSSSSSGSSSSDSDSDSSSASGSDAGSPGT